MTPLVLLAVGTKMPAWAEAGVAEYQKRFPPEWALSVQAIKTEARLSAVEEVRRRESERLLARVPPTAILIACDERGEAWRTEELAAHLAAWRQTARTIVFAIGGPDGFDQRVRARALHLWQLSRLTLPHAMVRVMVAEALYRAVCVLRDHPYHRGLEP